MKQKAPLIITILLTLLSTFSLYAQEDKLLTADKELSSSMINHIYQDRDGLIWISTEDGLNRYDGAKFTVYREMVENAFISSHVCCTFEDSRNRFFIGTLNGLLLHKKNEGTFERLPLNFSMNPNMNAHVSCIIERENGDILVGTAGHGIFHVKEEGDSLIMKQDISLAPSFSISNIYEDRDKRLWVVTNDKGIYLVDGENPYEEVFNPANIQFSSNIAEDIYGNLYIGDNKGNVYQYHRRKDNFFIIPTTNSCQAAIKTIYSVNQEEMLIATDGNGLRKINVNRGLVEECNLSISSINIDKAKVHTLLKDKQGNTWLGCFQKGVVLLPSTTNSFSYIGRKSATHNIIGECCVMALHRDHTGVLWIGTDNDGIYLVTPEGKQKKHFPSEGGKYNVPATIMSIFEDSKNQIWIGSYQKGLAQLNPITGQCKYIELKNDMGNSAECIYHIVEDNNQRLWVAAMDRGLFSIDLNTNKISLFETTDNGLEYKEDSNILHNSSINTLEFSASTNKLYIGTYDGLGCLDLNNNSFTSTWGVNRIMPGEVIYALCEDNDGNLWIATSKGVRILNAQTKELTSLTTKEGLPSNSIAAIECDDEGCVWISSNYGISRYRPQDSTLVNYYADDGLQGNEFSKRVSFKGVKGELNFGGTNGVTLFFPKNIINPGKKPQIFIADFYLKGKPIHLGMLSGRKPITNKPVSEATDFYLSHHDNYIDIEFSALEFYSPERISYHYNINNSGWASLPPGSNKLSFSNLAPGTYRLQLYNQEYDIQSDIKRINIHIASPWWLSRTAQIIYIIVVLASLALLFGYARRRQEWMTQMMTQKHKEELNEAKLQFFINVSHEIRTPMSLITSPLQKLMNTDKNAERQQNYRTIQRNAGRILQLINQLMDVRKIEKGQMKLKCRETNLLELINGLIENFEYQAQEKGINVHVHPEAEEIKAWVDPTNFDKVIMNLLSNAFKATPKDGEINIYIKRGKEKKATTTSLENYIEICVEDNGSGIAPEEAKRIFERFYQVSRSNQTDHSGTGVGLHLTHSIVELHHGTIWVENNNDKPGCKFIVRIPEGNKHFTNAELEDANAPATIIPTTYKEASQTAEVEPMEEGKESGRKKYKVLIIEDDEEIRQYICKELSESFQMESCNNGKDGLQQALQLVPDLIISDIMMPEMDGITLCKKIKQNVNINHIPVVLLSAKTTEEDTIEGLSTGADAYIVKPFSIEILRQTVHNLIKGRELLKNNFNGNQAQMTRSKVIKASSPDERLLDKVMKIINNNIGNTNLNVEAIAAEVGISRVHLHRKLKELTNQSTRDFIRNMRLQAAAKMLAEKRHSVAEVAGLTGFANITYFTTAFKELYGVPPTVYMEQHASAENEE